MEYKEAREKFIQAWGVFGSNWGINRTMAQVHALLMIAHEPLSTEHIMEELQISRGNANMNVRELIDWGLVKRELKMGERKEYFVAEKDMWKVVKQIMIQRRKRELEPMISLLDDISHVDKNKKAGPEEKAFVKTLGDITSFAHDADKTLERMIKADEHWFLGTFMRLMK